MGIMGLKQPPARKRDRVLPSWEDDARVRSIRERLDGMTAREEALIRAGAERDEAIAGIRKELETLAVSTLIGDEPVGADESALRDQLRRLEASTPPTEDLARIRQARSVLNERLGRAEGQARDALQTLAAEHRLAILRDMAPVMLALARLNTEYADLVIRFPGLTAAPLHLPELLIPADLQTLGRGDVLRATTRGALWLKAAAELGVIELE
jgi:hypothetical protein